jgi:hypothetical protein
MPNYDYFLKGFMHVNVKDVQVDLQKTIIWTKKFEKGK